MFGSKLVVKNDGRVRHESLKGAFTIFSCLTELLNVIILVRFLQFRTDSFQKLWGMNAKFTWAVSAI